MKKLNRAVNSVKNTRSLLEKLTQLTDFVDEIITEDLVNLTISSELHDLFNTQLLYDGSIKYDGHTINDTIWIYSNYDGLHKYDGTSKYNGVRKTAREYPVRTAFKYSSRTTDVQTLAVQLNASEAVALSEAMWFLLKVVHEDAVNITEAADTAVKIRGFQDTIDTAETFALGMCYHRNFDGQYQYDGTIKYILL
jgi:hypothetical protein